MTSAELSRAEIVDAFRRLLDDISDEDFAIVKMVGEEHATFFQRLDTSGPEFTAYMLTTIGALISEILRRSHVAPV